ncbi:MAG: hypothetical protein AAGH74_12160 [Pseudomonadota bacterium]
MTGAQLFSLIHALSFLIFHTAIAALIIAIWKDLKTGAAVYWAIASAVTLLPCIVLFQMGAGAELSFVVPQTLALIAGHMVYRARRRA